MRIIVAAIHGILTGQTEASWPDRFDAWMFKRDRSVKVLKKEYRAGPFPKWNCLVKDPLLARGLANELELFLGSEPCDPGSVPSSEPAPALWLIGHSNGAVIALLAARQLIERGCRIEGLILTGGACNPDIERCGILDWQSRGMLKFAFAYSSREDEVLDGAEVAELSPGAGAFARLSHWLRGRLIAPYGCLGRTGWMLDGRALAATNSENSKIQTRWFAGGHSCYFNAQNCERTFEQFYSDLGAQ